VQPISRRRFLATSAIVIVSSATACSGDADPTAVTSAPAPSEPDPSTPATTTAPAATTAPTTTAAPVELPADPFTLGVASGDASTTGVVLWTRLAPDPLSGGGMPDDDVEVTWEVARDEAFAEITASGAAIARASHGHSVHVRAEIDEGWSFYRFRVGGYTSPTGRTQRAPSAETTPDEVRFASASCQNYQNGFYTAHRDLAEQQPDFVVWLGDYIYEGASRPVDGNDVVRSHDGTEEVRTLDQYRNRYALYRGDPDLQAAHAACPWYVIWDDHEVENNYAGLVPEQPEESADFAERRRAGYQAWWEHMPVDLPPPVGADEFRIYRGFRWGSLLDLALLDGRQYRSDQACGDVTLNLEPACPETFDDDRTMLGSEQEAWLLDTLDGAMPATWKVVANQTVFGDLMLGEAVLNYDQWDGYPGQRNRIVEQVAARGIADLVVLTGDIHFAGTGTLRAGEPGTGTPVGVEFVATSISSGGNVNPAVADVLVSFPDIVDVELEHRGYILHTVTPAQWLADYRMVETVKIDGASVYTHAVYAVDIGTNAVRVAD
jgi:alkaline phosphatase D